MSGYIHWPHYAVIHHEDTNMELLRQVFPTGEADDLNVALFSTGGVHGTYFTIEDVESDPELAKITYVVIHPRLVVIRWGEVAPETPEDYAWLKNLRASSHRELVKIGLQHHSEEEHQT